LSYTVLKLRRFFRHSVYCRARKDAEVWVQRATTKKRIGHTLHLHAVYVAVGTIGQNIERLFTCARLPNASIGSP